MVLQMTGRAARGKQAGGHMHMQAQITRRTGRRTSTEVLTLATTKLRAGGAGCGCGCGFALLRCRPIARPPPQRGEEAAPASGFRAVITRCSAGRNRACLMPVMKARGADRPLTMRDCSFRRWAGAEWSEILGSA